MKIDLEKDLEFTPPKRTNLEWAYNGVNAWREMVEITEHKEPAYGWSYLVSLSDQEIAERLFSLQKLVESSQQVMQLLALNVQHRVGERQEIADAIKGV